MELYYSGTVPEVMIGVAVAAAAAVCQRDSHIINDEVAVVVMTAEHAYGAATLKHGGEHSRIDAAVAAVFSTYAGDVVMGEVLGCPDLPGLEEFRQGDMEEGCRGDDPAMFVCAFPEFIAYP